MMAFLIQAKDLPGTLGSFVLKQKEDRERTQLGV
jgi:hypothetical protein